MRCIAKALTLTLLGLIVLGVPIAAAWHTSSAPDPISGDHWDVRQRILETTNVNLDAASAGVLLHKRFVWDPEYTYQDKSHVIRIHISYTGTYTLSSTGVWNISVAKESTGNIVGCYIHVRTVNPVGITLDGLPVYPHFEWDCLFTASTKTHYHYHEVWVNRTSLSGTPGDPNYESISVRLETEDVVVDYLPGYLQNVTAQTNTYVNSSRVSVIGALLYRSGQTNSYINSTFGGILSNSTFNITTESEPMLEFPAFTEAESWALLFFFIIMAIALWNEGWFLAGSAFLALLGIVLGSTILPWTGGLLLVCIGIWLESFLQRKREREQAPSSSPG